MLFLCLPKVFNSIPVRAWIILLFSFQEQCLHSLCFCTTNGFPPLQEYELSFSLDCCESEHRLVRLLNHWKSPIFSTAWCTWCCFQEGKLSWNPYCYFSRWVPLWPSIHIIKWAKSDSFLDCYSVLFCFVLFCLSLFCFAYTIISSFQERNILTLRTV